MPLNSVRNYQKREKIAKRLEEFLFKMRKRGELMLPAERELCQTLQCSRETLRRALEVKEEDGAIVKKGRGRALSMEIAANKKILGRFTFVANGQNMVGNRAWNKLWTALQPLAEAENITPELALIPYKADKNQARAILKELSDTIVLTTTDNPIIRDHIFSMSDKSIITTEEHYRRITANIIAMDNYEAGFMAAQKIAEHGYRKPALISHKHYASFGKLYVPFERRATGFRDGCKECGLDFNEKSEFWLEGNHFKLIVQTVKTASEVAKLGFDSVFFYTDNDLDFLYEALAEEAQIPEKMGLVTVNSFDIALEHIPPVSAVSHGTQPVAETLIEQIKYILETGDSNIGEIMVKPDFHEGATLR